MTEQLRCHGCDGVIKTDKDGWILPSEGEVGEFYRPALPDDESSVLAHVGCINFTGETDSEWRIA